MRLLPLPPTLGAARSLLSAMVVDPERLAATGSGFCDMPSPGGRMQQAVGCAIAGEHPTASITTASVVHARIRRTFTKVKTATPATFRGRHGAIGAPAAVGDRGRRLRA